MKRLLTSFLLTFFISTADNVFGQVDTTKIKNFIEKQKPAEQKFISLLKKNKVDDCLKYFSPETIKKYGSDSLKKELKYLTTLFSKYQLPKTTYSLGQIFRGVGTFGHDSEGKYEKKSLYQFMDGENVKYYFVLYFNDNEPITSIKYYDSENFQEPFLKNLKPLKPIPTKKGN